MYAIEEINSMVKSAKLTPILYFRDMDGQDPELEQIFGERKVRLQRNREQLQQKRRFIRNVNGRQMIDVTGNMPVAGRSIGTGYTGNEIRHGGTYTAPSGGKPHSQIGTNEKGEAVYSDGNGGKKTYGQLASTQMMNRWNQAAKGGPISQGWKDYVANSKQEAASYAPSNPYQYTYAGSQSMDDQATAGRYAQQNEVSGSEFGSDSDQGVEGSAYRGRIIPRTQGKIVERQVNPPLRPTAKVPTADPEVQNALQPSPPPPPFPTPANPQVQNPNMYEDVGMDEQNIADNWSRFVPNQLAQQPQPNPSSSDGLDTLKYTFSD